MTNFHFVFTVTSHDFVFRFSQFHSDRDTAELMAVFIANKLTDSFGFPVVYSIRKGRS